MPSALRFLTMPIYINMGMFSQISPDPEQGAVQAINRDDLIAPAKPMPVSMNIIRNCMLLYEPETHKTDV